LVKGGVNTQPAKSAGGALAMPPLFNIAWPHNDLNSARVFYERRPIGSPVFGGMGGATVTEDIWIHQEFIDAGLGDRIREVIEGQRSGIHAAA
jgi:hypothetical protein